MPRTKTTSPLWLPAARQPRSDDEIKIAQTNLRLRDTRTPIQVPIQSRGQFRRKANKLLRLCSSQFNSKQKRNCPFMHRGYSETHTSIQPLTPSNIYINIPSAL